MSLLGLGSHLGAAGTMTNVWFKGHSAAGADLAGILEGGSWLQLEDRVTFACLTYQNSSLVLALLLGLLSPPLNIKL